VIVTVRCCETDAVVGVTEATDGFTCTAAALGSDAGAGVEHPANVRSAATPAATTAVLRR
jgi:hypothetical protein